MYDESFKLQVLFKKKIIDFLDELMSQCPERGDFFLIKVFVKDKIPIEDVLGRFIKLVLPYKKLIRDHDEDFFLTTDSLFQAMGNFDQGVAIVTSLKELWISDKFDMDDKEAIWKWLELFIKLAEKHQIAHGNVSGWD